MTYFYLRCSFEVILCYIDFFPVLLCWEYKHIVLRHMFTSNDYYDAVVSIHIQVFLTN